MLCRAGSCSLRWWLCSLALIPLTACEGSGLSKREAAVGARVFLDESAPFCAPLVMVNTEPPWIAANNDRRQVLLRLYEQLGLVASRPTTTTEKGYTALGSIRREKPALEFSLTPEGEAALVKKTLLGMNSYCFRYARARVVEVLEWTEPAPQMGAVVSRVTFTAAPESVATWADHPRFAEQFPKAGQDLAASRKEPPRISATLVKTNHGWRPMQSPM